ncbi:ATP-binding protein, partial [bacterium]|nr:ATP-binding protein [bacterium]
MKPFHTITVPHKDILEGRLTMDIFAADLWEVFNKRGPDEYKDKDTFFAKTYLTDGLKNLLSCVERRLKQGAGDPVVQLQTPFGGGKTHALIAMFHKADEWGAKKAVIVGTALNPKDTLWGILEKQLKGKIEEFSDNITPGKEAIKRFLSEYQPLLILMDEVLEYATKSAGVKVGASNLASQTIAFMQELTEVVSTLKNTCLVITLPSSIIEHYDQSAERLFQQLQKVAGRMEKIYTPVQEYEITKIIRRRLFAQVKENEAKQVVSKFIDYAEKEQILPSGIEVSEYRKRFLDSYPFLPEVIEVLYHRWGSFPTFQRTRGVLRLLSLVIYSLKDSNLPYISLADFDLSNQEIRQELLKHIGQEFNSIISADITDKTSGAKKVDSGLGDAYKGLNLGTRTSTTIFMYSFSGGVERGATIGEIKRTATVLDIPSSIVAESIENLRNKLFYLQTSQDKYFFSNQPNLNRILLTKTENIKDREVIDLEKEILKENVEGRFFKVFVWEENSANIPDSEDLKLLILNREDKNLMKEILETKGKSPRVNKNTLIFLCPQETEKIQFINVLRRKLAYEAIEKDKTLKLSEEQRKEVAKEMKKLDESITELLYRCYRKIHLSVREGLKDIDLGIPTYGEEKPLDEQIYEKLRAEGEILEKIAPLVIKEKYLKDKDYVLTEKLYKSAFTTPGEPRVLNKKIWEEAISEGV